jgi:fructose 1,6-bisphosphatase
MRALGLRDSKCAAFDDPPRTVPLGFQVANGEIANDDDGEPMIADMFADPAFRQARHEAMINATMLQTCGKVRIGSPRT